MSFIRLFLLIIAAYTISASTCYSQDREIGSWRSVLPYYSAIGVATNGNALFVAGGLAFSVFNPAGGQIDAYSKVEGMSDIGLQCIGHDLATSMTVLVYTNGNIDLFKDNTFYNIPELKIKTIAGAKNVYSVYTRNGLAYLSTSIGVIVLDLSKQSIKETYEFNVNNQVIAVKGFVSLGDFHYALTTHGIYRANVNSMELQNFQAWESVDTTKGYNRIAEVAGVLYAGNDSAVYKISGGRFLVYSSRGTIQSLDVSGDNIFIPEYYRSNYSGAIKVLDASGGLVDSIPMAGKKPRQVVKTLDGTLWIAEETGGLMKYDANKQFGYYTAPGPSDFNTFDIYANNKQLWIAHGAYDGRFTRQGNFYGLSNYENDKWKYYQRYIYRPFDTLMDFCSVVKDEVSGVIYAGSMMNGLFIMNPDGTHELLNSNSILELGPFLPPNERQVIGLALDSRRNLWVTLYAANTQLYVKTVENQWYKFRIPGMSHGGPLVVDDNNQVWFVASGEDGVGVYNFGSYETLGDVSDDSKYRLVQGKGIGNLPSNAVNCLAKDNNNNIWIGTVNGIGIVNNCTPPYTQAAPCDAEIPIVQYDQYAGYLFAGNNVRTIAVDGANRKWVGTDDGVWLLSPDAGKIVSRFTVDNSPLPSNRIRKIAIDKVTGDVYIGTEQGLVSYRGTATEGGTSNENIVSFPNPVPSGYTGTIAIKGLVANADVRITDISGQLVYRTKALGGQAVWSGMDYTGRRPQSGVYMIFASDATGAETYTGKLVFLK